MRAGGYLVRFVRIRQLIRKKKHLIIKKKKKQHRRERAVKEETQQFVYLVFRQHLCRVNLTQLSNRREIPPSLDTVIFFPGMLLPVGMAAFPYRSALYLVGGEQLCPPEIEFGHQFARPENLLYFNLEMYCVDPSSGDFFCPKVVPRNCLMTSGKPGAKAVIVDGKLYVITGGQHCFRGVVPTPRFECYDFQKNSWTSLPDPPFYDDISPISYVYLSVLGRQNIYVRSGPYYLVFDIDSEQWRDDYEYIRLEPFPFEFLGSIAEGDGGIFVAYTLDGLVAYNDSTLTRPHRLLPHLFPSLFVSPPDPYRQTSFIRHLGRNVFCHVLTFVFELEIHITTFVVSRMRDGNQTAESDGEDLLEASLLGHHVYNASSAHGKDAYPPTDVFTMCHKA